MGCLKLHIETEPILSVAYRKKGQKVSKNRGSYYPFGLKHKGYNNVVNGTDHKYGYNGVEETDELGFNILEMDMRQYDPAIARWTSIDPVTHHDFSTYSAFDNNPVFFSDPSGADSVTWTGEAAQNAYSSIVQGLGGSTRGEGSSDNCGSGGGCTCGGNGKCGNTAHQGGVGSTHQYAGYAIPAGGYTSAMRGGDPWEPTEEDAKKERAAFGNAVLVIAGEWATIKLWQGGKWVITTVRTKYLAGVLKYGMSSYSKGRNLYSAQPGIVKKITDKYYNQMVDGTFDHYKELSAWLEKGKTIVSGGNHRMNAAVRYAVETGDSKFVDKLLSNMRVTKVGKNQSLSGSFGIKTYSLIK